MSNSPLTFDELLSAELIHPADLSQEQYNVAKAWYQALPYDESVQLWATLQECSILELLWDYLGDTAGIDFNREGKVYWEVYDFTNTVIEHTGYSTFQDGSIVAEDFITKSLRIRQGSQKNGS
jgi:hypothetical protein